MIHANARGVAGVHDAMTVARLTGSDMELLLVLLAFRLAKRPYPGYRLAKL